MQAVLWEEWIEVWSNTWMNRQLICVYMDFCSSLESNICMANLTHCHLSLFQRFVVVQHFWCREIQEIVCMVPREWVKSKFLCQDADVMSFANKCIVVGRYVCGDYDKILMETGKFSDNKISCEHGVPLSRQWLQSPLKVVKHPIYAKYCKKKLITK